MRFPADHQLDDFPGAQDFLRCVDEELLKADEFLKKLKVLDNKCIQAQTQKGCDDVSRLNLRQQTPAFQPALPRTSDQLTMLRFGWSKPDSQLCDLCICACGEDSQECRCLKLKLLKPRLLSYGAPARAPALKGKNERENPRAERDTKPLVELPRSKNDKKLILDCFLADVREMTRNVASMQAALGALVERKEHTRPPPPPRKQVLNSMNLKKERNFRSKRV